MRFPYTAKVRGQLTEPEQEDVLREVGCEMAKLFREGSPVYDPRTKIEKRPQRDALLDIIRPGDQIVVVSAAVIARSHGRLFRFVSKLTAAGGSLYVVDQQDEFTADESHAALAEAMEGDRNRAHIAPARAGRKHKGGRKPALELKGERLAVFKRMWRDEHTDIAAMQREFTPKNDKGEYIHPGTGKKRKKPISRHTISRRAGELDLGPKA